jgi:hypothetical protein
MCETNSGANARKMFVPMSAIEMNGAINPNAINAARIGGALEDSGAWLSEIDGRRDYSSGAEERRSIYQRRVISASSYGRPCRLLGAR